ncbi:hypothetical protein JR316_0004348 [Psilocybe cubensis]|uniref:Uncharacterized protein n=1 Tax=Psilocybe cubensis TaxID=181762 RepID=A0ACB8H3F4_PSICU|nr:hypothetical protein JR316_0004348 [Psilocybe cubensis]KAH9482250.1 hypothetical protein JR316_0004348 [Psilocybe cubensis]
MAAESISITTIWSIFYHFFLDHNEYRTLLSHCRKLVQASAHMETWKASKYGCYIRFCTDASLSDVRRHWALYAESDALSNEEKVAIRESFELGMKSVVDQFKENTIFTSVRSAGPPFLTFAHEAMKSHAAYWKMGTTDDRSSTLPHFNPTFYYSGLGGKFSVHYGTEPLLAFHLAPALIPIKDFVSSPNPTIKYATKVAMDQFELWCTAFRQRISDGAGANLILRFHVGEALAFCRALFVCQREKVTKCGAYTSQWGGSQISLETAEYSGNTPLAPVFFNVIDTSNLTDHVGLLNLLAVTIPLLQRKPWAVIHTNSLVPESPDGLYVKGLIARACYDIPTLSLALGVSPAPCMSHFTTVSSKHEVLASTLVSTPGQMHEYTSWKIPTTLLTSSDREHSASHTQKLAGQRWQVDDFARFIFLLARAMFIDEDINSASGSNQRLKRLSYYTRESLVSLMALFKNRLHGVDWDAIVKRVDILQGYDDTGNCGQDFVCQLYLRDVFVMDSMKPSVLREKYPHSTFFRGWRDLPPVVCAVLRIPRQKLKDLENMSFEKLPVAILRGDYRAQTTAGEIYETFSSIRPIFGDMVVSMVDGEPCVSINEDLLGWYGESDLIVSFFMSSWALLEYGPEVLEIGFGIKASPATVLELWPVLGFHLDIYSTSANSANVHFVRHRPNNAEELHYLRARPTVSTSEVGNVVEVKCAPHLPVVESFLIRYNITEVALKRSLAQGAAVTTKPISDSIICLSVSNYERLLSFPFAIYTNKLKVKIAQAPIRPVFEDNDKPAVVPFTVACTSSSINLLNVHYLNLNKLPALQFPRGVEMKFNWLGIHLGMSPSDREKKFANLPTSHPLTMVIHLKQTINTIFLKFVELGEQARVIGLRKLGQDVGIYALIFINDIRFDLSAQTVVVDACAIPLYKSILPRISDYLGVIAPFQIITDDDETLAWKTLLPVFAERCRTWKHKANCEYLSEGFPLPSGLEGYASSTLCSCGKGKDLGAWAEVPEWRSMIPEATRIAISPLFTFSTSYDEVKALKFLVQVVVRSKVCEMWYTGGSGSSEV